MDVIGYVVVLPVHSFVTPVHGLVVRVLDPAACVLYAGEQRFESSKFEFNCM